MGSMGIKVIQRLFIAGIFGVLAMAFRCAGDIVSISWKWGESVGYLLE